MAAREHVTVRANVGANAHARFEAEQEALRSGGKWTRSDVLRAWFVMGRQAWLEGRRPND